MENAVDNPLIALLGKHEKELTTKSKWVSNVLNLELNNYIRDWIVPGLTEKLKLENVPKNNLSPVNDLQTQYQLFQKFVEVATEFDLRCKSIGNFAGRICDENILAVLLAQLPVDFDKFIHAFYFVSFRIYSKSYETEYGYLDVGPSALSEGTCYGCLALQEKCNCEALLLSINTINTSFLAFRLLDRFAGQAITCLVKKHITDYIKLACHGTYDRSHLKYLEAWLGNVVIKWLICTFNYGKIDIEDNSPVSQVIQGFRVKLTYFLYETYALSVIEQFFNVLIDFPDSIPAIDDLKICIEKIDMRKFLIKSLKETLQKRVLHPGVNTMDIITGYVAAIKAVRHLDNSGVILESVTEPIKEYLRKRTDTVRRVVAGLTEDGPSDLSEELARSEEAKRGTENVKEESVAWENWMPDPFGIEFFTHTHYVKANRSADIISMVVDIYGSKELFMNEYQNLMAERLLTQLDFNTEKEIRNLELLKIRFGETLLHNCEVMLKDVADSKRINFHIQGDSKYQSNKSFDISSYLISAQFWPSFNKESLELPTAISDEFKRYTDAFESYKGNRTLNWRFVTGRVNIEIEFGNRTMEMTVPPTQAVIIYHFQEKNQWTLEELSNTIKVPSTVLRKRIGFWLTHGLINEVSCGVFKLAEEKTPEYQLRTIEASQMLSDDEALESAMASANEQREEELQVFWSYILGMLTNLDSLPLERIHQMLKLFASNRLGLEISAEELREFLQEKVKKHKLTFSGGVYQLPK